MVFTEEYTVRKYLSSSAISEDNSIYILDSSNNLITGVNMDPAVRDFVIKQDYTGTVGTLSENITLHGNQKYAMFYSISDYNGWKYVVSVSMDTIISKVNYIWTFTLIISLVSVAIGFILSYRLACRNYKPLANLLNNVRSKIFPEDQSFLDEYNFLDKTIDTIFDQGNKAKLELALCEPLAKNACLLKLISGDLVQDSHFENVLKTLNIIFDNSFFTCISVLFNTDGILDANSQEDISNNLIHQSAHAYFVNLNSKNTVIILNTALDDQIRISVNYIREYLSSISTSFKVISIGNTYKGIDNIVKSYNEAAIAADYRFLMGEGCLIYFSDLGGFSNSTCYYYPIEKENIIMNHVKTGDSHSAIRQLKEILDENMHSRKLAPDTARQMFYDIAATAFKALEDMGIAVPVPVRLDGLLALDSAEEMMFYIEDIYLQICNVVLEEKESQNINLRQDILQYINDNFAGRDMSLTYVAEVFNISPNYLSRFIKDQTGYNFVDYLNKCRIDASKALLGSDSTIAHIAQKVGFNNDVTFRRLFKKYEGVTPGQYKESFNISGGRVI